MDQIVKASVAMITFNQDRFIAQAVESALAQETDFDFEIVVGDDCSTDFTLDVLSELQREHPDRLRVIQNTINLGMARNFAATLRACSGTYVAWLEGDDYWTSTQKLQRQVDFLDKHTDCTVCCHRVEYVDENGRAIGQTFPGHVPPISSIDDLLKRNFIQTCSAVVRRCVLPELPEWMYPLKLIDWPYFLLLAQQGRIAFLDEVMAAYRIHEAGVWSPQPSARRLRYSISMLNRVKRHFPSRYAKQIDKAAAGYHMRLVHELRENGQRTRALRHYDACRARGGADDGLGMKDRAAIWLWRWFPGVYTRLKRLRAQNSASDRPIRDAIGVLHRHGFSVTWRYAEWLTRYVLFYQLAYRLWVTRYDTLDDNDRTLIRRRIDDMPRRPLISVIMPVYNTREQWLRAAIDSVRGQLYPDWELCIADDASTEVHVRRVLEEYQRLDSRIRCVFRESNGHIAAASNSALAEARGEFIAILDHDDVLTEHALYLVAEAISDSPEADIIYSDEDKIDESGRRFHAYFKTDWNPDLMLSHNMVSHLGVYRTSLVRAVGGFRGGFEGSQDYDLSLRVSERAGPDRIRHIPHVLYHWRATRGSVAHQSDAKPYAYDAALRAIREHLERRGAEACVTPAAMLGLYRVQYALPADPPRVSVIITTRDRVDLLERVMNGMLHETDYPNFEVIVMDNASRKKDTLSYLDAVVADNRVRVMRHDGEFNFAAINNAAVPHASGSVLCLLNNDVEIIHPDWLTEMVSHAIRPEIGVVGALLFYPNDTMQHAGVIMGLGGVANHAFSGLPKAMVAPFRRARLIQNFSAVTAACMVLRRSVFEEVGGFDADAFAVAYNDVDLCLRIGQRGYRILWTPYAQLYHRSSATLGPPRSPARRDQFQRDVNMFKERWGHLLANDPFYNPNLSLDHNDYRCAFPPRAVKPWRRGGRQQSEP